MHSLPKPSKAGTPCIKQAKKAIKGRPSSDIIESPVGGSLNITLLWTSRLWASSLSVLCHPAGDRLLLPALAVRCGQFFALTLNEPLFFVMTCEIWEVKE